MYTSKEEISLRKLIRKSYGRGDGILTYKCSFMLPTYFFVDFISMYSYTYILRNTKISEAR